MSLVWVQALMPWALIAVMLIMNRDLFVSQKLSERELEARRRMVDAAIEKARKDAEALFALVDRNFVDRKKP